MTTTLWMYWIGGVLLGGLGAFLICWSLLGDRLAGNFAKRRCSRCWYDMSAVAGLKCPECGREARCEKRLHRSRRRWKIVILGLIAGSAGLALNFFALGPARRWTSALPMWAQLRLIDGIGPLPVLSELVRTRVKGSDLSDAEFHSLEQRVLECLEDPSLSLYEKQILLDCFHTLGRTPADPIRFGSAVLDYVLSGTNLDIPNTAAIAWGVNMQGPAQVAEQALKQLGPQRDSRLLSRLIWAMVKGPMDEERVCAIADVTQRMPARIGFGDVDPILNAHAEVFFGRILDNLRKAHGEDVLNVLSPVYMLLRSSTTPSTARDEVVKTAAELLGNADPRIRSVSRDVMESTFGEKLLPALPELVAHLSDPDPETRAWARRVLTRLQISEGSNKVLLQLLVSRFCDQDAQGKLDTLELFRERIPTPMAPLRADIFACLEKIDDVATLDGALSAFFPDETTGVIWKPQGPGPTNPELRLLLAHLLQQPGARTSAAARWMGARGDAMTELHATLVAVASDASRSSADRAAARDALLHIRDRTTPALDPLSPLKFDPQD